MRLKLVRLACFLWDDGRLVWQLAAFAGYLFTRAALLERWGHWAALLFTGLLLLAVAFICIEPRDK